MPAVLIAPPATAGLRVVALSLLDRLVVATHRAGCTPITVVATGPLPDLRRSRALGIAIGTASSVPTTSEPAFLARAELLVTASDVRRLLAGGGRLAAQDGTPLPAGIVPPGNASSPDPWQSLPAIPAAGVALPVRDNASARAAGEALWASLASSSDGTVDRHFNRPVGRALLSRWLVHTPITPNQISVFATLLGTVAGVMFGWGDRTVSIVAAILFQLSAIIDCVDGDVARSVFKESALGKWLDIVGDQVVHAAVFAGIAVGLGRSGAPGPFLWLGGSTVLGGLIAFGVVLRGMRRPGGSDGRLQKLIDATTNRDFSVLVLALALADRLGWFLWMAAIGSHVFWIAALALQLLDRPRPDNAR